MDLVSVLTIIGIAVANIGTTITLFLWATNRADLATADHRRSTDEYRTSTQAILKSISDEMKDFHGRLCAIEERSGKCQ